MKDFGASRMMWLDTGWALLTQEWVLAPAVYQLLSPQGLVRVWSSTVSWLASPQKPAWVPGKIGCQPLAPEE